MKSKQSKSKTGLTSGLTSDSKLRGHHGNQADVLSTNNLNSGQVLQNNFSVERVQSLERNTDTAGGNVRKVKMRNIGGLDNRGGNNNSGLNSNNRSKDVRKGSRVRVRLQKQ